MFGLSKTIQWILEPDNLLAFLLVLGALLVWASGERATLWGRRLVALVAIVLLSLAVFPVGEWALAPLENQYAKTSRPNKVDGIILLTGDESPKLMEARRGLPVAGHSAQRYLLVARLAKTYPNAKIVVVGTTSYLYPSRTYETKDLSQAILDGLSIDSRRVMYERKSRTTRENALDAYKMVKPTTDQNWLLVTSAFHMPRAVLSFSKVGWRTLPVQADYLTTGRYEMNLGQQLSFQLRLLRIAFHEYYGLLGYWLAGWIERPW